MTRWEYTEVACRGKEDAEFRELGADGWELVAVTSDSEDRFPVAYFKRPIEIPAAADPDALDPELIDHPGREAR